MNDFTKEELEKILKRYDKNSVRYILDNNISSFKKHCTCGAFEKKFIKHQSCCPQEQEVIEWINNHE